MKAILFAAASAICAAGCIAATLGGFAVPLTNARRGLSIIAAGLALAVLAKTFDRLKMRAIHGPALGDRLHEQNEDDQSDRELAQRDYEAYRQRKM